MSLGDQLRHAREAAELSQTELAELAGMQQPAISAMERDRQNMGPSTRARLEEALRIQFQDEDMPYAHRPEDEFSTDEAPKPRTEPKKAKPRAKKAPAGAIPLSVQLQVPYQIGGTLLASRLPVTANALVNNAEACATAWDQFLMRYPALREKLEQGMVAADVLNLIYAHWPILQAAREELAMQRAVAEGYAGGLETAAA